MKRFHLKALLIILVLILFLAIFFLISNLRITGNIVNQKMITKAICGEKGYCEDYEIIYENNKIVSIKTTGFSIWK